MKWHHFPKRNTYLSCTAHCIVPPGPSRASASIFFCSSDNSVGISMSKSTTISPFRTGWPYDVIIHVQIKMLGKNQTLLTGPIYTHITFTGIPRSRRFNFVPCAMTLFFGDFNFSLRPSRCSISKENPVQKSNVTYTWRIWAKSNTWKRRVHERVTTIRHFSTKANHKQRFN